LIALLDTARGMAMLSQAVYRFGSVVY